MSEGYTRVKFFSPSIEIVSVAVKDYARHQACAFRVPDGHVAMIIQARRIGKRAHQGWPTIHNRVVWMDLLGRSPWSKELCYRCEKDCRPHLAQRGKRSVALLR